MPIQKTEKIWHNGKLINWDDAKIHVLSHVVSYGSAVFEGIRCYETKHGPAIFRLREHMQRLINSAKIYRMELPFPLDDLCNAATELVRVNKMNSCYIKPIALRGYGEVGVNPLSSPIDSVYGLLGMGTLSRARSDRKGVDVCVSSWNRMAPNTLPSMAKAAANYMNSQLIRMEASVNGYAEGIALDTNWLRERRLGRKHLRRHDGVLYTPPLGTSVLPGITRNSVITLARRSEHSGEGAVSSPAKCCTSPTKSFSPARRRKSAPPLGRSDQGRQGRRAARSHASCRKNFSPSPAAANPIATTG